MESKEIEKKEMDRRGFVKTAVIGAATMVVGGALGPEQAVAAPYKWGKELNTNFVKLMGTYGKSVIGNARKLTKKDVINLQLHMVHDPSAKVNDRIKALNALEIRSIEDAVAKWHKDVLAGKVGQSFGPMDDDEYNCYDGSDCSSSSACCCCCPCCCCAAATTDSKC